MTDATRARAATEAHNDTECMHCRNGRFCQEYEGPMKTRARAVAEEKYKSACVGQHMTADEYAAFDAGWDAAADAVAEAVKEAVAPYPLCEGDYKLIQERARRAEQAVEERDEIIAGRADMLNTCQQTIREQVEEIARLQAVIDSLKGAPNE